MKFSARRVARSLVSAVTSSLCCLAGCGVESDATRDDPDSLAAQITPPKIESVSMEGPGCPDSEPFAIGISGSRDTFRINFPAFAVDTRDGAQTAASTCTVSVLLDGVDGVAYAPAGVTLTASTSAGATLTTTAYWASTPDLTSEDITSIPGGGTYLTGALNEPRQWSACAGPRELRFTLKLSLDGKPSSATVERLGNLRFVARACEAPSGPLDAGDDPLDAASVAPTDAATVDVGPDADADADADESDAGSDAGAPSASRSARVSDVLTAGLACPATSAAVGVVDARDSFEVDFSRFSLAADETRTLGTSDCSVNLQVDVPPSSTIAIDHYTLRGSASLPAGATARLTTYYSFVGVPKSSASKVVPLAGPFEGPFTLAATFGDGELLFRNCDEPRRRLNIRLVLSIRAGEAGAPARASLEHMGSVRFVSRSCE